MTNLSKFSFLIIIILLCHGLYIGSSAGETYKPTVQWSKENLGQVEYDWLIENNESLLVYGTINVGNECRGWSKIFNSSTGDLKWSIDYSCNSQFLPILLNDNEILDHVLIEHVEKEPFRDTKKVSLFQDKMTEPTIILNWSWPSRLDFPRSAHLNNDGIMDIIFENQTGWSPMGTWVTIEALSGKDLSHLWSFDLNEYVKSEAVYYKGIEFMDADGDGVEDPIIWIEADPGSLFPFTTGVLLDGNTGEPIWKTRTEEQIMQTSVVENSLTGKPELMMVWNNYSKGNNTWMLFEVLDSEGKQTFQEIFSDVQGNGDIRLSYDKIPNLVITERLNDEGYFSIKVKKYPKWGAITNLTVHSPNMTPHLSRTNDINGDGNPEFIVSGDHLWIFNGSDSALLKEYPISGANGVEVKLPFVIIYRGSYQLEEAFTTEWFSGVLNYDDGTLLWELPNKDESHHRLHMRDFDNDGILEVLFSTEVSGMDNEGKGRVVLMEFPDPESTKPEPPSKTSEDNIWIMWIVILLLLAIASLLIARGMKGET